MAVGLILLAVPTIYNPSRGNRYYFMHQWTEQELVNPNRMEDNNVEPGTKRGREEDKEKDLPVKKRGKASATGDDRFRLSGKQLFLTYPQCDITKEDAFLQLSEKLGDPEEYIIAQEKHEVGEHSGPVGFLSAKDYIQWADTRAQYHLVRMKLCKAYDSLY